MAPITGRRASLLIIFWVSSTLCLLGRENLKIPRPAPMFVLPTWDGKVVKSASLKGQVVVLEFFQTWCPDCQHSSPELEKLYRKYKERGLTIVGISHDREGVKAIEPFVKKYDLTYPVVLGDLSIAVGYVGITREDKGGFRIPYLVLIDREGNIVAQYEEGIDKEATDILLLESNVRKLLGIPAISVRVSGSSSKP